MTNPLLASYQWAKTTITPLKIGKKTGVSSFTSSIKHNTGSPSHNRERDDIKGIQIEKEEEKLRICR